MKKTVLVLLAACTMSAALPAMAQQTKEEKDMCLLASKNCLNEVDSIQKRIRKIQAEIRKGTKVYSADELNRLRQKLQEANEILINLEK